MKERILLFFAVLILSIGIADAKPQKIKYGKYVYYEGEVVNKQPNGKGSLVLVSPTNKKENVATLTGDFAGLSIKNANITSSLLPDITTTGNQPIRVEVLGKMGKIEDISFNFANVSFFLRLKELYFSRLLCDSYDCR